MKVRAVNGDLGALAALCFQRGNLAQADLLCRAAIAEDGDSSELHFMLGQIGERAGLLDGARRHYAHAKDDPAFAARASERISDLAEIARTRDARTGESYLLIKAWGQGFWSDVTQVLGHLLVAEITGRTPVVHWGRNSRYSDHPEADAFRSFFDPVSALSLDDLLGRGYSYFPPKWHDGNLADEQLDLWQGPHSRFWSLSAAARPEDVVVADFAMPVFQVVPWLPDAHPLSGRSVDEVYRALIDNYLRPRRAVAEEISNFVSARIRPAGPLLAVHVRETDKGAEAGPMDQFRRFYHARAVQFLREFPEGSLFLMTDSADIAAEFSARYGSRVLAQECRRSRDGAALHFSDLPNRHRLGVEIMTDTYAAAACDAFIGFGSSNVGAMVDYLKIWPVGSCLLLTGNGLARPNLVLHDEEGLLKDKRIALFLEVSVPPDLAALADRIDAGGSARGRSPAS
ncbi:MAG: hypothetical protein GY791_07960 [Alphaproteobacteria bacterium]|nr:hypothetical protein [Alphaproteobacteria bacterium]